MGTTHDYGADEIVIEYGGYSGFVRAMEEAFDQGSWQLVVEPWVPSDPLVNHLSAVYRLRAVRTGVRAKRGNVLRDVANKINKLDGMPVHFAIVHREWHPTESYEAPAEEVRVQVDEHGQLVTNDEGLVVIVNVKVEVNA